MPTTVSNRTGNSGAEERFIQLFCDVFGPERGQYVYMQHPFVDIYGGHRTIDFALRSSEGRIAILTPDGLRFICDSLNRDPEAIGKHMLEVLARMQNKV